MQINKTKYFVEVVDWEGTTLLGRMIAALDGSCVSFQRSPMSYKCKCRPTKPVNQMSDEDLMSFYEVASEEHDTEFGLLKKAMDRK